MAKRIFSFFIILVLTGMTSVVTQAQVKRPVGVKIIEYDPVEWREYHFSYDDEGRIAGIDYIDSDEHSDVISGISYQLPSSISIPNLANVALQDGRIISWTSYPNDVY